MEPANIDALVKRLVDDPHDHEALVLAHEAGSEDPRSYALLLERVGAMTNDAGYASHWLSEAAQVWSVTVGDAHRAARVLMQAIDRDPTQRVASERLAELYRDKGDTKGLIALQERRVKALTPLLGSGEDVREELLAVHDELAKLWSESLSQPRKALPHLKRVAELDPASALAIYNVRETMKELGQLVDALPLYAAEVAVEPDAARKVALLRDEAVVRKSMGDLSGAARALGKARLIDANDAELQYEFASTVVEQVAQGEETTPAVRSAAVELLVGLAEQFDGEHGIAYASAALDISPGHDRALELLNYYARALGRESELPARQSAYLQAAPEGEIAADVRMQLSDHFEKSGDLEGAASVLEPLLPSGHESVSQRVTSLRQLVAEKDHAGGSSRSTMTAHPGLATESEIEEVEPSGRADVFESDLGDMSAPSESDVMLARELDSQLTPSAGLAPDAERGSKSTFVVKDTIGVLISEAKTLAAAGEGEQALAAMRQVLRATPSHQEALDWTCDRLAELGKFQEVCEVLRDALNATPRTEETRGERKAQLVRLADVASRELHDDSTALAAYDELLDLDPDDSEAIEARDALLAAAGRWADLVESLESRRDRPGSDSIALGERLAEIHGEKLGDEKGRALELDRLTRKEPTLLRVQRAVISFEAAGDLPSGIACIGEALHNAASPDRPRLLELCGDLYQRSDDALRAAESYRDAARLTDDETLYAKAERAAVKGGNFALAGESAARRTELAADDLEKAASLVRHADYAEKAGNSDQSVSLLEKANLLAPADAGITSTLTSRYEALGLWKALADLLRRNGERATSIEEKLDLLRRAARLYSDKVGDNSSCRELQLAIVGMTGDADASNWLLADASASGDDAAVSRELDRQFSVAKTDADRVAIALRQASHASDALRDSDAAIQRYEFILKDLDPRCRPALRALASIYEAMGEILDSAGAVLRELPLAETDEERTALATKLARLGEQSGDLDVTVTALEHLAKADPDDFDVLDRLCTAYEQAERWDELAETLPRRIEAEADEDEISALTLRLAQIKHAQKGDLDGALTVLMEAGKRGDRAARARFIELATNEGRGLAIGPAIEAFWLSEKPSPERSKWLRVAFDREAEGGKLNLQLAMELLRTRNPDRALAEKVESAALVAKDESAIAIVEEALTRTLRGFDHSKELLRQSRARVDAGLPASGAIEHALSGMGSVPDDETSAFLASVANLSNDPKTQRAVYEGFARKARTSAERTRGFVGAARIAAADRDTVGAATALTGALAPPWTPELLDGIERAVRESSDGAIRTTLTTAFLDAVLTAAADAPEMAAAQAALYRRAATIAVSELGDKERGLTLLARALHAHADASALGTLSELVTDIATGRAVEAILTDVLGTKAHPAAKSILEQRARIRQSPLEDLAGAAADLKQAHDLAPNDVGIGDQLAQLLEILHDHRALVHLLEEQIVRSKDVKARTDLARRIARLWDLEIGDAREAADGWRRVLRLAPGDAEATEGLDRSKLTIRRQSEAAVRAALPTSTPDLSSMAGNAANAADVPAPTTGTDSGAHDPQATAADTADATGATAALPLPRSPSLTDEIPLGELPFVAAETSAGGSPRESVTEVSLPPSEATSEDLNGGGALDSAGELPAHADSAEGVQLPAAPPAVEAADDAPTPFQTEPPRASATQQQAALDLSSEGDGPDAMVSAADDDVVIADELAEMIDDDDDSTESDSAPALADGSESSMDPESPPQTPTPSPSELVRVAKSGPPPLPQA